MANMRAAAWQVHCGCACVSHTTFPPRVRNSGGTRARAERRKKPTEKERRQELGQLTKAYKAAVAKRLADFFETETGARVRDFMAQLGNDPDEMLNQIEADKSGVVSARLVDNGQPVEFGQALFVIT